MEFAEYSLESYSAEEFSDPLEEKYRLSEKREERRRGLNYSTTTPRDGSTSSRRAASRKASGAVLPLRETSGIEPVHPHVEELRYADRLEHCSAVIARAHDRSLDLVLSKRANQGDCRFLDVDTILFQLFGEIAFLQIAQAVRHLGAPGHRPSSPRQFDSARLEKCGHHVVRRFAIDVAPVIGVDVKRDECFACFL